VPRKPTPAPTVAVVRVANGYIVCENDRLLPTQICTDFQQVMQSVWHALHPDEIFPSSPGLAQPSLPAVAASAAPALPPRVLVATELAAILRVETRTIRLWTQQGMPTVPAGSKVRYRLEECERWLREQKAKKQAKKPAKHTGLEQAEQEQRGTEDEKYTRLSV
jgi:hypothetical protein